MRDLQRQRAILYLRVSDPRQVESFSLSTQEEACREYCARNGWDVARVFREEGQSAKTTDRDQLQTLMRWVARGRRKAEYLVVYRLSRSARDVGDYHAIKAFLGRRGIQIRTVMETIEDSAQGRFLETMLAAVNQLENEVRGEQCKSGMQYAARQGRYVWLAPYGYRNGPKGAESLEVVEAEALHVRWAFETVAAGASMKDAERGLAARGAATDRGALGYKHVRRILKNPVYYGRLECAKWGVSTVGDWQPLVSRELWLRTQQSARAGSKWDGPKRYKASRPEFPLRRFVLCDSCGKPITASHSRSKSGSLYAYYHCNPCRARAPKAELEAE